MEEPKGFKVEDKRRIFKEDKTEKEKQEKSQATSKTVLPPVSFSTFIVSLSSSTLVHLGEIPDPITGKKEKTSKMVLPPVSFSTFIVSLSSSTLVHLGEIPDPITGKKEKNLDLAKQTIEILEMLKEKTKGNLDNEEESLLNNLLFDLRVKYVKLSGE